MFHDKGCANNKFDWPLQGPNVLLIWLSHDDAMLQNAFQQLNLN